MDECAQRVQGGDTESRERPPRRVGRGAWTRRGALGVVRAVGLWVHPEVNRTHQDSRMEETWDVRARRTDTVWCYSQGPGGVRVAETESRGWGPGLGEGRGVRVSWGQSLSSGRRESSGDGRWGWRHNSDSVLNAPELDTEKRLKWLILLRYAYVTRIKLTRIKRRNFA